MYALVENGVLILYPYSITDLRRAKPDTSFPNNPSDSALAEFGVVRIYNSPQPDNVTNSQVIFEDTPTFDGERWNQTWGVRDKTAEEIELEQKLLKDSIVSAAEQRLNVFANSRGYDNILSLCTYASSTVPKFAIEGQYGVGVRDATWAKLYEILAEVESGVRPPPTSFADIEPELPVLEWTN